MTHTTISPFERAVSITLHPDMPFFGVTPDGIVSCDCCGEGIVSCDCCGEGIVSCDCCGEGIVSCDCCGEGIVEVKCPFCKRSLHLAEAADDGKFCLQTTTDGTLRLKEAHQYYYQVQMQIAVCQKDYCNFVVWTEQDLHFERTVPNHEFWTYTSNMATHFFRDVLLLELVGKFVSRPSSLPADDDSVALSADDDSVALSADALLKAVEYTAPASTEELVCVSVHTVKSMALSLGATVSIYADVLTLMYLHSNNVTKHGFKQREVYLAFTVIHMFICMK